MRLPGRLAAAIAVLEDIEARRRPASEALKDWGNSNRFAGAGDRAAIGNLVYDALRRRASHAWRMGSASARALVLAVAVRDWGENPETLAAELAGDRFAPEPPDADEIARLSRADALADAPDPARADVPEWTAAGLARAFGPDWIAEGQAMAGRPPLDMRVNTLKSRRDRVMRSLQRFAPEETPLAPDGLRIRAGEGDSRTPNVQVDEAYLKGWFEVQDQGSQIVARLTGARAGEQVLDFCAGAGGKTLAMAAMMGNSGQVFAHDSARTRLAPIYDRLKRNGVRNAQVRPPEPGALDTLVGRLDRVVVDAPCTGTGTWRRRPDAKWKLTADQLGARTAEQHAILAEAARYVRPGGALAYITCSILPEENEDQLRRFLGEHPEFSVVPALEVWREQFPGHSAGPLFTPAGGLLLTPRLTDTDGFFFARLLRAR